MRSAGNAGPTVGQKTQIAGEGLGRNASASGAIVAEPLRSSRRARKSETQERRRRRGSARGNMGWWGPQIKSDFPQRESPGVRNCGLDQSL